MLYACVKKRNFLQLTLFLHILTGFVRNLVEPLKEGHVRLLLNAGDHASMQASLKECLVDMGVDFKARVKNTFCFVPL